MVVWLLATWFMVAVEILVLEWRSPLRWYRSVFWPLYVVVAFLGFLTGFILGPKRGQR
jgi:hypothetical protein